MFPRNGEGWFETNIGYSATELVHRLKKMRRHNKDRKDLIDDLIKVTERLQDQNHRLLEQAEVLSEVISGCDRCNETLLRRTKDASKKLGQRDLG